MLKELSKTLLKDRYAPHGNPAADLKTALYLAACTVSFNLEDRSSRSVLRYSLEDVGYKVQGTLQLAECRRLLNELVEEGALKLFGQEYVRAQSLKESEVKVRAKRQKNYLQYSLDDDDYLPMVIFYVEDDKGQEYRLRAENLVLMPEDVVRAALSPEKNLAFALEIVKPRRCVLGTMASAKVPHLLTDDFALEPFKFVFSPNSLGEAKPGNVVIAEIVKRSPGTISVKTREVIKDLGKLNYVIVKAVLANNIPSAWPHNMSRALSRIPDTVGPADIEGRRDVRDLPLVTIDGEDARDFDDAVYVKREGSNFRLYVAIADVSYYVRPGTVLDKEAVQRCNSVYFPNYVIPMLPEKLSNGICSLNPNVDRLCMVCEMEISNKGRIGKYEFYPAVMNSHARLTYTEAAQMLEKGTAMFPEHTAVIPQVKDLHALYQVLLKARDARGGFEVEGEEVHFVFNEELKVIGLTPVVRNDAHKLIEECMIAANVAAASFIAEHKAQTLYRVHSRPTPEKLEQLQASLVRFGLQLPGGDTPSPQDYNAFCHAVAEREDGRLLGQLLLRSMSKAEYSPDNIGHFGLALEKYAHFTSPIRRYADLQLHRSIKFILEKENKAQRGKIGARSYSKTELIELGKRCTEREIAADHAEYDVDNELKCILVKSHVGEIAQGTVSAVTSFGAFIRLDDFLVDGLLFIGNISDQYVSYNERTQSLSHGNFSLRVGDKLEVLIASCDPAARKIDLMLPKTKQKNKAHRVERDDLFVNPQPDLDLHSETDALFASISDLLSGDKPQGKTPASEPQQVLAKAQAELRQEAQASGNAGSEAQSGSSQAAGAVAAEADADAADAEGRTQGADAPAPAAQGEKPDSAPVKKSSRRRKSKKRSTESKTAESGSAAPLTLRDIIRAQQAEEAALAAAGQSSGGAEPAAAEVPALTPAAAEEVKTAEVLKPAAQPAAEAADAAPVSVPDAGTAAEAEEVQADAAALTADKAAAAADTAPAAAAPEFSAKAAEDSAAPEAQEPADAALEVKAAVPNETDAASDEAPADSAANVSSDNAAAAPAPEAADLTAAADEQNASAAADAELEADAAAAAAPAADDADADAEVSAPVADVSEAEAPAALPADKPAEADASAAPEAAQMPTHAAELDAAADSTEAAPAAAAAKDTAAPAASAVAADEAPAAMPAGAAAPAPEPAAEVSLWPADMTPAAAADLTVTAADADLPAADVSAKPASNAAAQSEQNAPSPAHLKVAPEWPSVLQAAGAEDGIGLAGTQPEGEDKAETAQSSADQAVPADKPAKPSHRRRHRKSNAKAKSEAGLMADESSAAPAADQVKGQTAPAGESEEAGSAEEASAAAVVTAQDTAAALSAADEDSAASAAAGSSLSAAAAQPGVEAAEAAATAGSTADAAEGKSAANAADAQPAAEGEEQKPAKRRRRRKKSKDTAAADTPAESSAPETAADGTEPPQAVESYGHAGGAAEYAQEDDFKPENDAAASDEDDFNEVPRRPLTLGDLIRMGRLRYDPAEDTALNAEEKTHKSKKHKKKKGKKKDKKNGK